MMDFAFDDIPLGEEQFDFAERNQASLEESIVKAVLKDKGYSNLKGILLEESKAREGVARLSTLDLFNVLDFPYLIAPRTVPRIGRVHVFDLLRKFKDTTLYQAWLECADTYGHDQPIAMSFNWPHAGRWVLHKSQAVVRFDKNVGHITWKLNGNTELYLDYWKVWIKSIDWAPSI